MGHLKKVALFISCYYFEHFINRFVIVQAILRENKKKIQEEQIKKEL